MQGLTLVARRPGLAGLPRHRPRPGGARPAGRRDDVRRRVAARRRRRSAAPALPATLVAGAPSILGVEPAPGARPGLVRALRPARLRLSRSCKPPSAAHPFGTDNFGRDVLSRVIWAYRIDMQIALFATLPPLLFGTMVGALVGYYRRLAGHAVRPHRRCRDHLPLPGAGHRHRRACSGPASPTCTSPSAWSAGCSMPGCCAAEIQRAEAAATMPPPPASWATADARIILRHLLPNAITPAIVYWMTDMALAILLGSSLGYLGLGAQPPAAEWGVLIADGKNFMTTAWWISVFPGHRHRDHRARLQPARRRPRRPAATAPVSAAASARGPGLERQLRHAARHADRGRRHRSRGAAGRGAGPGRRVRARARA